MMLPNIQEKFERLTQQRQTLLQHLDSLSPEALSFKAGPDRWSVVEAVEHRVLDIIETLHFIDIHFENHVRHINKILAQMKK